jgi:hypothetical protein
MSNSTANITSAPSVRKPGHPAPQRAQVSRLRLTISLFGAPLAWLLQMALSEPLAAQACYPHSIPLALPQLPAVLPSLQVTLGVITGVALLLAVASTILAWFTLRATHQDSSQRAGHTVEHGGGRAGFLTVLAFMGGLLFIVAILISGSALLLVSPCGGG